MADPVLWDLDDHTSAKHRVLRAYLDAWIPVMGHQALKVRNRRPKEEPRLLLVDGFAGPGRYATGEPGSPLIVHDALTSHVAFPELKDVKFLYLFIEQDERRVDHLRAELDNLTIPPNIEVYVEHGSFETKFREVVDDITPGHILVPTFAFIDPFGYSSASMSLTGQLLDFPRSEALYFLPLSFIHRFVGRRGQEAALTQLFDTDEWKNAIPLEGDDRRTFLISLFERQLRSKGRVKHVATFELRTRDRQDYRLVFATGHERGLELMKDAMWRVDPLEGTRYAAHTKTGQEVLFTPEVDTSPLLAELRSTFEGKWFTVAQASRVTLLRTPFLPNKHLKRKTLAPAEQDGVIEVKRPQGRRAGSFTDDVKIRFV